MTVHALFDSLENDAETEEETRRAKRVRRLFRMNIGSVHLVDRGANRKPLIIKKGEPMPTEIIERDGELFAIAPTSDTDFTQPDADDDATEVRVAKAETLPTEQKRSMVSTLTEVVDRGLVLLDIIKSAGDDDDADATVPEDIATEATTIGKMLAGFGERVPSHDKGEETVSTEKKETDDVKKTPIAGLEKPGQGCEYCDEGAAYALVFDGGKMYKPVCGGHVMKGMADLKSKGAEVERKVAMTGGGKAEKTKKADDDDKAQKADEKKGKKADEKSDEADTKKADEKPEAKADEKDGEKKGKTSAEVAKGIFEQADELVSAGERDAIMKAGRKMSKARYKQLRDAVIKLLGLAKELDPGDAQEMLATSIEKRADVLGEWCDGDDEADVNKSADAEADGEVVDDGNTSDEVDFAKGDSEPEPMWGLDLNDPSLHKSSVDKEISFFD